MNLDDVTSYDDFIITGSWGFNSNDLNFSGILNYDKSGIKLDLNRCNFEGNIEQIYGQGTLVLQSGENKGESILIHSVSLLDCHVSFSGLSFASNKGSMSSCECICKRLFVGTEFVDHCTKYSEVVILPTNLSQWIYRWSDRYIDECQSNPNENTKEIVSTKIKTDSILSINNIFSKYSNNNLMGVSEGYEIKSYISIIEIMRIDKIDSYLNCVEEFCSLVMNSGQHIIGCKLILKNGNLHYFNNQKKVRSSKRNFSRERFYVDRNEQFFDIIINALKKFILEKKYTSPIYGSLSYFNIGTIDQQLSRMFSGIDIIASNIDNKYCRFKRMGEILKWVYKFNNKKNNRKKKIIANVIVLP